MPTVNTLLFDFLKSVPPINVVQQYSENQLPLSLLDATNLISIHSRYIAGNLGAILVGCVLGWSAPTLKKLRQADSMIHLTILEEGWLASASFCGGAISSIPTGQLMNYLGRKGTLLFLAVVQIVSWILIYFSNSSSMLIIARFFAGIYGGGAQFVIPAYLSEICEPHVRGMFSSFTTVCLFIGNDLMFIVAPYVTIHTMAIVCITLDISFLILFSRCPESPYFYAMRQRPEAAVKSLKWLRGEEPIEVELDLIRTSVEKEINSNSGWIRNVASLVTVPANRRAFFALEIMFVLYAFCGFNSIRAYSSVVLPPQLGPLTSDHCTIIIGVVDFASGLLCMGLIDKVGRKPLLYFSSLGIAISMFFTGVWYFLNEEMDTDVSNLNWLPFAGFIVFGCSFSFGVGPIPKIYQSEVLPSNLKGQASALTMILLSSSLALIVGLFPVFSDNFGVFSNFFLYSAGGALFFLFTYFCVMETRGKTLQMIRAELEEKTGEKSKITDEVTKM